MIQRIQTLFLLLIVLLSVFLLSGSLLNFTTGTAATISVTFTEVVKNAGGSGTEMIEKLLPLTVLIIFIPLISLVTIFLYEKRKLQLRLALGLIILTAILLIAFVHVSLSVINKFNAQFVPGFKTIIPLLMLILAVLAYRGIRKDDQLVKSYDRLR
jgi:hypothetical protein